MVEIITKEVGSADLKETVNKLIPDSIGKDIEKACHSIYPLYDVFINKVKVNLRLSVLCFIYCRLKIIV